MAANSIQLSDELSKLSPMIREATTNARSIGWSTSVLLQPGDVIMFLYEKIWRLALVVINDTGKTTYKSLRNNTLLTCFHLDSSEEIRAIILKSLYKKRLLSERQSVIKGLKAILGIENYRSYMISKMSDIKSLNLDMSIIELVVRDEEEGMTFSKFFTQLGSKIKRMFNFFGVYKRLFGS